MYNCEILNMYDVNNDGLIGTSELQRAVADNIEGRITEHELDSVKGAWVDSVDIGTICPVHAQDVKTAFIPFAAAAVIMYTFVKLLWK